MLLSWIKSVWVGAAIALLAGPVARANVVLDWNRLALDAVRHSNSAPTQSTRNLAILNLAIWDAGNSIWRTHQPYRFQLDAPAGASAEAAMVGAASTVVRTLYPSHSAPAEALLNQWKATTVDDVARADGLALGAEMAALMINERADDGSTTQVTYVPGNAPGEWRRTPPFYRPELDPHWGWVTPFALRELDPFVAPPPPPMDSAEYAEAFAEVAALGREVSPIRTDEQSLIAVFWSDFSYTAMPPGHWYEIAVGIAEARGEAPAESARLMALLSLAQADAAIACWAGKYRYNFWRPLTAVRRADEDGNPATEAEAEWNSWLIAPNFPEYPSGHSTFSRAAADVLAWFYGTDAVTFTARSDSVAGVERIYNSLRGCADEVGMSRIYGGIHFQFANREGKASGARVAREVVAHQLLPLAVLPLVRFEGLVEGRPRLRVHAAMGRPFRLEASGDFRTWRPLTEGAGVPGGVRVDDEAAAGLNAQFYRVVELP